MSKPNSEFIRGLLRIVANEHEDITVQHVYIETVGDRKIFTWVGRYSDKNLEKLREEFLYD